MFTFNSEYIAIKYILGWRFMLFCERVNTAFNAKQKVRIEAVLMPFLFNNHSVRIIKASKRY